MKKDLTTDVLINGAGPTGLMMACQLAVHKIPFRIIDKKIKRENFSGAMILHARSMEIIHQLGISLKFLREGIIVRKINFQFNYKNCFAVDVSDFGNGWSLFPYIFIIEQTKTESLLTAFVKEHGYEVEEGTTLTNFAQKDGVVTSVLQNKNGQEEVVSCRFLVEAGGNTSFVRKQLNIPFDGITHSNLLFVSDSEADMPAPYAELLFSFTKHQTLGFFPLPNNRWRIDGAIPNLGNHVAPLDFDYVVNYLKSDNNLNIELVNSTWFSVFRSHSRFVPVMKHHHCFLAGDAAHVHSPVGAQGMNTGLHDAHNLAWKLAFFLKGYARAIILDTYQEERLPVAKNIIRYTDKAYGWLTQNNRFNKYLRLYAAPSLLRFLIFNLKKLKIVRHFIFMAISGAGVTYRRSSLSSFFPKRYFDATPLPGDPLPCLQYFIGNTIYNIQEKVKYTSYKLLIFGATEIPDDLGAVVTKYNHLVEMEIVPMGPGTDEVFRKMVKRDHACYLIRPDLYIGWRSDSLDARDLDRYLRKHIFSRNVTEKV